MQTPWSVPIVLGLCVVALTGCGDAAAPGTAPVGTSWELTAQAPLTPRHDPLVLAVGGFGLVLGGSDSPPCPPTADCAGPDRPAFRDGARYDPVGGTWQLITEAPLPLEGLYGQQAAVVGDTVYLLLSGQAAPRDYTFLSYDVSDDRWEHLATPALAAYFSLSAAGDRVVAYASSHEQFNDPTGIAALDPLPEDFVYDPVTAAWTALPPDPLRPSFDRFLHQTDAGIVMLTKDLVPNPGTEPPVTRAARLDPVTLTWSRLPDGDVVGSYGFWPVGDLLVNVSAMTADGGDVNGWGRDYPNGGIFDLEAGWSALPGSAPVVAYADLFGPVAGSGGGVVVTEGLAFTPATGRWDRVPTTARGPDGEEVALPDEAAGSAVLVTERGPLVLLWGGTSWPDDGGGDGRLHADGFIWSPAPDGSES